MSPVASWIDSRLTAAPPALLEAMTAAVEPFSSLAVPEALAQGASRLYAEVLQSAGTRRDAVSLLAADALFTHAMEAQAELNPAQLGAFAGRWSGRGRLGDLA